jgi:hypothetical protein
MTRDTTLLGKLSPGDVLRDDWTLPHGWVREVLAVIRSEEVESSSALRGQAERCALYGGSAHIARGSA